MLLCEPVILRAQKTINLKKSPGPILLPYIIWRHGLYWSGSMPNVLFIQQRCMFLLGYVHILARRNVIRSPYTASPVSYEQLGLESKQ